MGTAISKARQLITGILGGARGDEGAANSPGESSVRYIEQVISQISALMTERERLVALRDDEREKSESLNARLEELERGRIEALTDHRVGGDVAARKNATDLLGQANEVRQEINDAQAVANDVERRIRDLDRRMEPLKRNYRQAMGIFLDAIYRHLSDRYNKLAPEVGEIVLQIAALQRVMLRYLVGNTNGFSGQVLLPGIKPGEGRHIEPLLDAGSARFDRDASERMEQIFEQMRSAGFIWRFN